MTLKLQNIKVEWSKYIQSVLEFSFISRQVIWIFMDYFRSIFDVITL